MSLADAPSSKLPNPPDVVAPWPQLVSVLGADVSVRPEIWELVLKLKAKSLPLGSLGSGITTLTVELATAQLMR